MGQDLLDIIKQRRSIRKYMNKAIPDDVVAKIMEAARWAPSPANRQSTEFIIVKNDEIKLKMAEAIEHTLNNIEKAAPHEDAIQTIRGYGKYFNFFKDAPIVLVVTYRPRHSIINMLTGVDYEREDLADISGAAAAIQNILLTAHYLGYGGCWMTGPLLAEKDLLQILNLKSSIKLAAVIPIGRPAEIPEAPKRKEIDNIVRMVL